MSKAYLVIEEDKRQGAGDREQAGLFHSLKQVKLQVLRG